MTQNNLFSCLSWQGIVTKQWNQLFETAEVLVAYKAEWCYHSKRKDLQNKDWQKEKAWTAGLGKRLATSQTSYHHAAERGESGLFERRTYIKEPLKRNTHKSHVERGRAMLPVFLFPPDLHTFTSRWGKEQLCWNICHCDTVTLLLQNVNFKLELSSGTLKELLAVHCILRGSKTKFTANLSEVWRIRTLNRKKRTIR